MGGGTEVRGEAAERLDRRDLEALQLERLRALVHRLHRDVPFYRARLEEAGVRPEEIRGLEDLRKLPFTLKSDLRDHYPFGLFAVPPEEIVRIHASTGTTGKPTVVGYTPADIELWAEVMARTLASAGVTSRDVLQNAYGYGLFTGGLGIHYGAERLGATVVPASTGNTKRQVTLLQDLGSTVLCCTPSYALHLAEVLEEAGISPGELPLRIGVFGAEPWTEGMRREIERGLGIDAFDIYGLSEIIGPGVAAECEAKAGLHVMEDHFLPEIIDPETGEVLGPGEKGELVITTLTKEGIPLLRYRTRDITRLEKSPCPCGRTTVRMERITGRSDDMLIIRGVNVFPSQIESVLLPIEGATPHYLLVVDRAGALDTMEVHVETTPAVFEGGAEVQEGLVRRIRRELASTLGIAVTVKLQEPGAIARSEGKAVRVVDRRKL